MPFSSQAQSDARRTQVLLVHRDDAVRRSLQLQLHGWGFQVRAFGTAPVELDDAPSAAPDIFLLDDEATLAKAGAMLAALRCRGWHGRAILMARLSDPELSRAAAEAGFEAVLRDPPRDVELASVLGR